MSLLIRAWPRGRAPAARPDPAHPSRKERPCNKPFSPPTSTAPSWAATPSERAALYDWIGQRRNEIVLIYVTGRSLTTMRDVLDELPLQPDHIISDVGTAVYAGAGRTPLPALERWLDEGWPQHTPAAVRSILARHPHLTEQPVVEGRRVSCFYSDEQLGRCRAHRVGGCWLRRVAVGRALFRRAAARRAERPHAAAHPERTEPAARAHPGRGRHPERSLAVPDRLAGRDRCQPRAAAGRCRARPAQRALERDKTAPPACSTPCTAFTKKEHA